MVHVLATATHSGVACLSDTREQEREMVCATSPPLPLPLHPPPLLFFFFFAFDSKMDDCNHRSHQ